MIEPRKIIKDFRKYETSGFSREGYLRLDMEENTIGCSDEVIKALRNLAKENVSMYPDCSRLRQKLAASLDTAKENILLTNGSDEAIKLIMDCYIEEQDEVVMMEPSFVMYDFYARLRDAKIKKVLLEKDLSFNASWFIDAISEKTKLAILCNPNNPTATIINREDIIRIIEKASGLVLVDEAYFEYTGITVSDLITKYPNLVVIRTFSKAAGLAGLRLGYAIADQEVISNMEKISSPFNVNSIAILAAEAALSDTSFPRNYAYETRQSKEYIFKEMEKLGIKAFPTTGKFFLADFGDDAGWVCEELKNEKILIKNRDSLPLLKGCARIGLGTMEQSKVFISALKKILIKKALDGKDTLLFDMDGVLVDVSDSYRFAIKKTAEFFLDGKEITYDDIQSYKEKPGNNNDWDCTQSILRENGINVDREIIIFEFDKIYLGGAIDNERLIVDIRLLEKISKKYRLGIVTGRPKRDADYTIGKFGIRKYFSSIITFDDVKEGKPSPEGISKAMRYLSGKNAVYFGDTIDDMLAAKKAGIEAIGVIPQPPSKKITTLLRSGGAKIILDNINEVRI